MLKLTNYIPEVYKQICDLIDSVSVKMLMLVLGCSVHTWHWRLVLSDSIDVAIIAIVMLLSR